MAVRLISRDVVEVDSPLYGKHKRTDFVFIGRFWEGPEAAGETGRYVNERCSVSHARGHWANCSAEYAERHGLAKMVA